jgi:hypothetical protein
VKHFSNSKQFRWTTLVSAGHHNEVVRLRRSFKVSERLMRRIFLYAVLFFSVTKPAARPRTEVGTPSHSLLPTDASWHSLL